MFGGTDNFSALAAYQHALVVINGQCAQQSSQITDVQYRLVRVIGSVLGLGWSATIVAGSTLLNDSVPVDLRASAQGLSDLVMGLAGASAGALSGLVVELWSYPRLTLLAALATVPLIALLAMRGRNYVSGEETA